jgi:hypothetical protein
MKRFIYIFGIISVNFIFADQLPKDCTNISSDILRLKCYDKFFSNEEQNETKENYLYKKNIPAKEQHPSNKPNIDFGLNEAQKKIKDKKDYINTLVISVSKLKSGKTRFRLKNEQLWESQSTLKFLHEKKFIKDINIRIEEARLGGFWMIELRTMNKIKVKRVS